MMYEIRLDHEFDAAHRIVGHEGKCARLHGHSYRVDVNLGASAVKEPGFVLDYGVIKARLDEWDHRMLLWERDPLFIAAPRFGDAWTEMDEEVGVVRLPFNPTAENMAAHLAYLFLEYANIRESTVTVRESGRSAATVSLTA